MKTKHVTEKQIEAFRLHLAEEEKSGATMEKYMRDVRAFAAFAKDCGLSKDSVKDWKEALVQKGYAVSSVNSMLASMNSFLSFIGMEGCKVKNLKTQRQVYCSEEKELTKAEYMRLLRAADNDIKMKLIMETICSTGIRVSELRYFTVEAVQKGYVQVRCKGKIRTVLIPGKMKKLLLSYAKKRKIKAGAIFLNRAGKPMNRSSIWAKMKRLCTAAGVAATKVFPHNLRKLFARMFYEAEKDIAKLADVLGHSSINTTRIYIMTTGTEHRRKIERLGLVV